MKADISLKGELEAAAEATVARYGKVHILVSNVGVGGGSSYGRWTLSVNLMSVVRDFWSAHRNRTAREGRSFPRFHGRLIAGAGPAYNVTKYGVVALSEALRVTLAPRGIGVSVLCPGFIRTRS